VLLVGHSREKSLKAYKELVKLQPPPGCAGHVGKVAWAAADIRNTTQVAALVAQAVTELGGLDIAVNDAGSDGSGAGTKQVGSEGFLNGAGDLYDDSILDINLKGTLKCMHHEIAHFHATGTPGVIVNVGSIAGETSWMGPLYTSSKWAMVGFTRQAALAQASKGIRINTLAPGAVNTTMLRGGLPASDPVWLAKRKAIEAMIPAGRIGEPWEMAGPITFLASDMASYVTGITLTADGDLMQASPNQRMGPHAALEEDSGLRGRRMPPSEAVFFQ